MTDEEFDRHALELLECEVGADELARFLRLSRSGGGDYTRGRESLRLGVRSEDAVGFFKCYRGEVPA